MDWYPVLRELHLYGGGRVLNGMDQKADLRPSAMSGKIASLNIKSYGSFYGDVKRLGFQIIGCDFFHTEDQAKSFSPPEWRCLNTAGSPTWLCTDQGHDWSFIANTAFLQRSGVFYDMASRISHQIKACEWRLRQLSEAYSDQLNGRLFSKTFKANERFLDGHTSLCYLALQSFLVDGCTLRDYLCEFYSEAIIRKKDPSAPKITALSGLLKFWRSNPPHDKAGKELRASSLPDNWLYELGAYRDLVVHVAPLANAAKTLLAFTKTIEFQGELLPAIQLPIPLKPAEIKSSRTTGQYFDDPNLNFARGLNFIEDMESSRDALEYAHISMQQLGALCSSVSHISPFAPEVPIVTPINLKVTKE
ncbi:hypothetical protein [Pseudomonas orientalis]|uniref:Uncharacterized protein n=1 Tax=Pseudomonas orientalis TaxID=76758 RepID=A0A8B3XXW0_9PSED|nr:hypothetical protein [Pseudomonas orientalis]SDU07709.1 hypothetical protein SAMN04490197_2616 [Pseudomonas orientalis]